MAIRAPDGANNHLQIHLKEAATATAVSRKGKVEKLIQRSEIDRLAEGYKRSMKSWVLWQKTDLGKVVVVAWKRKFFYWVEKLEHIFKNLAKTLFFAPKGNFSGTNRALV